MPCKALVHSQRSTKLPLIARDTGQAIFEYPESIPPKAATNLNGVSGCWPAPPYLASVWRSSHSQIVRRPY
eukprot:6190368-Pleurochrysis_carterae.AAC.6